MSATDFEYLLNKIGPEISKMDTNMRKCIPVQERLAVTLRFLATGDSYQSLAYLFKFLAQLISSIIPEVCQAIINALQEFIKLPKNCSEWEKTAAEFEKNVEFSSLRRGSRREAHPDSGTL
ncbi:hypothetical protein NQ318_010625 [Aromia moschata]|uniref:Uncharacterized protein n=1 Tax=Aromia moschata TaxID=1265417 RepID=A0AAV8XK71_9CUCU|nr:hypothetical protein NQ318_010625 [Aromia moschata]